MSIEWRVVAEAPCYEVSNRGDVRRNGRLLRKVPISNGYHHVSLYQNGDCLQRQVHRLVLDAFHGPKPFAGAVCRHLDNDKTNNDSENVVWGSQGENLADQVRHGTKHLGHEHPNAKLSPMEVKEIRESLARGGRSKASLARQYGVHGKVIHNIAAGRSYINV